MLREVHSEEPLDRAARRRARDRAAALIGDRTQILSFAEEELHERALLAGDVPAGPELRIGLLLPPPQGAVAADPSLVLARRHGGVQCDEDLLPFADASFARITSLMTLHGVNDLPGALVLMRRALLPGGRFHAVFPAGMSLARARQAFLQADTATGGAVSPRVGPTVDPAEAAGLLARAGFADPVAEIQMVRARYADLRALALDVRAHGDSGWLSARGRRFTSRQRWAEASAHFAEGDRRVEVQMELLFLSARAPDQG